jgi:uncharacterized membrane protein YkvA (DUF1232 family)
MGGDHTGLTIVLGFIAIFLLIGVVLLAVMLFVIFRYRVPLRGIAAMAGALVYVVSPVDVLPEAVLGPFGLIDDVGVVGAVSFFIYRLIQARRNGAFPAGDQRPALRGRR